MKKLFFLFLALVATTCLWAHNFEVDGIYYNYLDGNNVEVTYRGSYSDQYDNEYSGAVSIPSTITYNGTTYSITSIGYYAFGGCSSLTSITIPNSVTSIGVEAFYYCSSLTSITIPNSVTSIGNSAFYECDGLTSVTIPNSVTSIGNEAFYECSSLTSVTIGNSVTSIGDRAFSGCSKLTLVTINSDAIVNKTYSYSSNISDIFGSQVTEYIIGDDVKGIGDEAFHWCYYLTSVTIPNSVTSIGDQAFRGCSSLTSVTIPNSVTSIGDYAFHYCTSLTFVTIGNGVTSIGESAFDNCSSLTSVTIPNSVTSIGWYAFNGCSSLTSPVYNAHCFAYMPTSFKGAYVIPEGIKQIAGGAFSECSSLTSVTIPNSVTSIGEYAFWGCSSLTSPVYNAHCFAYMPTSFKGAYVIPEGIKQIAGGAFYECSSLTSVTIPNSVTSIGWYAFKSCSSLTSVTCEAETPPTVRQYTFYDVSRSIPVYVPCGCVEVYKAASGWSDFTNIQEPLAEYSIEVYVNDTIMGTAKVNYNTFCEGAQISATPNISYHFVQWSDGVTDNPRTLELTQDTILIAEFAPNTYTITTVSSDTLRGTTQGDTTVNYLENVTISATANYGYHFSHWNDYNYDNPRQVQVTENKTYTAYFDKNTYYITKKYDSNQGYINGSSSGEYLDNITLTAEANYGYHFVQWSDGSTENPRSLILTQDTTLTAEFAPNTYTITTVSSDTLRGTTQGDTTVNYLENVTISATANYGYHFSHWNDYNYDNPRQVQMTKNKTYTAYFDKNTYYITKNYNSNQGYVNGSTSGEYLDNITLTAEPNCGYHFLQWSDGNIDNPRTLTLTQDTVLTAEFAQSFSGQCGDNLYWNYDTITQTISITGSGEMYNYTAATQPWLLFKEEIKEVTIANTATSIGTSAFEGCIRLGKISLGTGLKNIAANAFAGCTRLYDIYVYATYPPFVEESSFANYNVYVYIPCEYQRDYILDVVWGKFKFIECIGAESEEVPTDSVVVSPGSTDVTITWPTEEGADTYTIVIKKDGEVFCTITFNAEGQLLNIAFAPGRDGNHPAQYAEAVANGGYRFTVTGLEEGTHYTYDITVKDASNQTIHSHTGAFTTQSTTAVDNVTTNNANTQKLLCNGQLIILRDGVEYNAMGAQIQ